MLKYSAQQHKLQPVVFIVSDYYLDKLSPLKPLLENSVRMLIPDESSIQTSLDKKRSFAIAQSHGIAQPSSYFPDTHDEFQRLVDTIPLPFIIKPRVSHLGKVHLGAKVWKISDREGGKQAGQALQGMIDQYLIQEMIPGDDDHMYDHLGLWWKGEEVCWLTLQKLRQNPPLFGDGSYKKVTLLPELREKSHEMLKSLGYHGFFAIEYKLDPRDNQFKQIEINARTIAGNQLAIASGVDFPWLGYRLMTGQALPSYHQTENIYFIHETWDIAAYIAGLGTASGPSLFTWLRQYLTADCYAEWAADDPLPLLHTFLNSLSRKLFRNRSGP